MQIILTNEQFISKQRNTQQL